jgi:hypothetical protein
MTQNILYWFCNRWNLINNISDKLKNVQALMGPEYGTEIKYAPFFPVKYIAY